MNKQSITFHLKLTTSQQPVLRSSFIAKLSSDLPEKHTQQLLLQPRLSPLPVGWGVTCRGVISAWLIHVVPSPPLQQQQCSDSVESGASAILSPGWEVSRVTVIVTLSLSLIPGRGGGGHRPDPLQEAP